jgi:hypothetical protein
MYQKVIGERDTCMFGSIRKRNEQGLYTGACNLLDSKFNAHVDAVQFLNVGDRVVTPDNIDYGHYALESDAYQIPLGFGGVQGGEAIPGVQNCRRCGTMSFAYLERSFD